MKKPIAVFIAIAMLLTLASCAFEQDGPGETTAAAPLVSEQPVESYTYTPRFVELGAMENLLILRCRTEGGFFATADVMVSNTIPAGVTPEYETQFYEYEQRLYFVGDDGAVRRLRGFAPIALNEDLTGRAQYTQSFNIAAMLINDDGVLTELEAIDEGWYKVLTTASGKEKLGDYIARQRWFIRTLDENGAELTRSEIKLKDGEWLDGYKTVSDGSGGYIVIDNGGLRGVDAAGETLWKLESAESVGEVLKLGGDAVCALCWSDRWSVRTTDVSGAAFGESVALPKEVYTVYAGGGSELLYNLGSTLFAFNVKTGESRELFNWLNCDINVESVSGLTVLYNGDIAGVVTEFDTASGGYVTELFILERGAADKTPKAASMSLGTVSLDSQLRPLIIAHNRSGKGLRIDVRDYSAYPDAAARLAADIRGDSAPDIIDLEGLDARVLAAEGLLTDLYPYIDDDKQLDRADYFENFLASCEYDGALISACQGFYIKTVIGAVDVVGSAPGWTLADFNAAAKTVDPDASILEYYSTRYEVMNDSLALCYNELIDTAAGQCNFQTELFADILRFAAYFPESFDHGAFTGDADDSTYFRLRTGRQMLTGVNITAPEDIFACDADFENGSSFIGYPVAEGVGSALVREAGLAVSAQSKYKDEAWSFVRYFLTEDCQSGYWGIPGIRDLYDDRLAAAMTTEYYNDANGDKLLDDYGEPIAKARCSFGDKDKKGDAVTYFYAVTEQQADRLKALIDGAVRSYVYDEVLFKLVRDKTTAYFAGTLGIEDAMKAVQSAVTLYLHEG